jgi:glycosyltransferase involved in cell wall biosynthesis
MKVSVVIVTKNRENDLKQCLGSLVSQSAILDELIIIDNNSSDSTKQVIKSFSNSVKFKIKYICEKKIGYPKIYNRGLVESSYNWVAFIDDDCVASIDWYKSIKSILKQNKSKAVVLGKSQTYWVKNFYSQLTLFIDRYWKEKSIKQDEVVDLEILDNKNIVYSKQFLRKNKLSFDESRIKFQNGASEDCDLGMQIQEKGGQSIYCSKIMVYHKDPKGPFHFYKKLFFSTVGHLSYEQKWKTYREKRLRESEINFRLFFNDFCNEFKVNTIKRVGLIGHLFLSWIIIKITKIIYEKKYLFQK